MQTKFAKPQEHITIVLILKDYTCKLKHHEKIFTAFYLEDLFFLRFHRHEFYEKTTLTQQAHTKNNNQECCIWENADKVYGHANK